MAAKKMNLLSVANDLRHNRTDMAIMMKYDVTPVQLRKIKAKLAEVGLWELASPDGAGQNDQSAPESRTAIEWTCPSCKEKFEQEHESCPACGIHLKKYWDRQVWGKALDNTGRQHSTTSVSADVQTKKTVSRVRLRLTELAAYIKNDMSNWELMLKHQLTYPQLVLAFAALADKKLIPTKTVTKCSFDLCSSPHIVARRRRPGGGFSLGSCSRRMNSAGRIEYYQSSRKPLVSKCSTSNLNLLSVGSTSPKVWGFCGNRLGFVGKCQVFWGNGH